MIYEYVCKEHGLTHVIKPATEYDREEKCPECGKTIKPMISAPYVSTPQMEAHYNPGLGKVVKNRHEIKEEIRKLNDTLGMDIVEVGNSRAEKKKPKEVEYDMRGAYQQLRKVRGK